MVNLHFSYKAGTASTPTNIEFSILLPEVFVSALLFPQGSPPEAHDQGYYSLGLLPLMPAWGLPMLPMGAGGCPCAVNREQQD